MDNFIGFNQAAHNNREAIAAELARVLVAPGTVLEIGSGSGQHAAHFVPLLPQLRWQPTEIPERLAALASNLDGWHERLAAPLELVVGHDWPVPDCEYAYSANVLHIVPGALLEPFMKGVAASLLEAGILILYGPFKYGGEFTTASNAAFDEWLKARDPASGIRDIETVTGVAARYGLQMTEDVAMPANNQLLVFRRT